MAGIESGAEGAELGATDGMLLGDGKRERFWHIEGADKDLVKIIHRWLSYNVEQKKR